MHGIAAVSICGTQTRVAVPGRNQALFCCILRPHYTAFETLWHRTFIKGGVHARYIETYQVVMQL